MDSNRYKRQSQTSRPSRAITSPGPPRLEGLEDRTLFSADILGLAATDLPVHTDEYLSDNSLTVADSGFASTPLEFVFVDAGIADHEIVIDSLSKQQQSGRNIQIHVIEATTDGIEEVTAIIQGQRASAVHIISHGSSSGFQLGTATVDANSISSYENILRQWTDSLTDSADLLLYGCQLTVSAEGQQLINSLANLTGADIATSDDITGHASLGGDWLLENRTGTIEAATISSLELEELWNHTLLDGTAGIDLLEAENTSDSDLNGLDANDVIIGNYDFISEILFGAKVHPGAFMYDLDYTIPYLAYSEYGLTTGNSGITVNSGEIDFIMDGDQSLNVPGGGRGVVLHNAEIQADVADTVAGTSYSMSLYLGGLTPGLHAIEANFNGTPEVFEVIMPAGNNLSNMDWQPISVSFNGNIGNVDPTTVTINSIAGTPIIAAARVVDHSINIGDYTLRGGAGNDVIMAGGGTDTIFSGPGNDYIHGGNNNDTITDGYGKDIIFGGLGDDTITDGPGNDRLSGNSGNDTIIDSLGNDVLSGGVGSDNITVGAGTNVIVAGSGNDTVYIVQNTQNNNTISGGSGDDTYVLRKNIHNQFSITDTNGSDRIVLEMDPTAGPETYFLPDTFSLAGTHIEKLEGQGSNQTLGSASYGNDLHWDLSSLDSINGITGVQGGAGDDHFGIAFTGTDYRGGGPTDTDVVRVYGNISDYNIDRGQFTGIDNNDDSQYLKISNGSGEDSIRDTIEFIDFNDIRYEVATGISIPRPATINNQGMIPEFIVHNGVPTSLDLSALDIVDDELGYKPNNDTVYTYTMGVQSGTLYSNNASGGISEATAPFILRNDSTLPTLNSELDNTSRFSYLSDTSSVNISDTVRIKIYDPAKNPYTLAPSVLLADVPVTILHEPALDSIENGTETYPEGNPGKIITSSIEVTDPNIEPIESATVRIVNVVPGEDLLQFTDTATITANYNAASGTLSLTGDATPQEYQDALRSISYRNTSQDPDSTTRTIEFMVNDGIFDSNTESRNININPANDAPALYSIETSPANYTENSPPVSITSSITINDVDNVRLRFATLAIASNYINGEDILLFTDQYGLTGDYDSTNGVLTISGNASINEYEFALRSVTYQNISDAPSTAMRTVDITVSDSSDISNTLSRSIVIDAVNDAPVLTSIEVHPATYTEGLTPVAISDTLVLSDVDDTHLQAATVVLTSNFESSEDQLNFIDQAGITGTYNPSSGTLSLIGTATLSDYETALRSVTYVNSSLNPTIIDRSAEVTVTGTSNNSNTISRDISITPINDAPTLTGIENPAADFTEGQTFVAITNSLVISDADDTLIQSAQIAITGSFLAAEDTLEFTDQSGISGNYSATTGILTLVGTASAADYENAIRSVTYNNTSDNPSTLARTIDITVSDNTLNSNVLSRDVNITPVNDAPIVATIEAMPAYFIENSTPLGITGNLAIDDIDNSNIESAVVRISNNFVAGEDSLEFTDQNGITGNYNPNTGTLNLTGTATLAQYQTAIHSVGFYNTSDNPTILTRTVSFTVNDGNADSNTLSRDILLAAINDAPVLSNLESSLIRETENIYASKLTDTLTIDDADDTVLESATVSIVNNYQAGEDLLTFTNTANISGNYDPATGKLLLSGTAPVAEYQTALRKVGYMITGDDPSTLQRKISISVNDGDADSSEVYRFTETVPVNDAPLLINIETNPASFTENQSSITLTNSMSIEDVDNTTVQSALVQITGNLVSGEDVLNFTDTGSISGSYDPGTGILILTGSDTRSNYTSAIRGISYQNISENPDPSTRTIGITVNDGDADSNTLTRDININPVNDAPVLTNIEAGAAIYTEGLGAVAITDTIVTTDIDDSNADSASIQVTGNFVSTEDHLNFIDQNGITGNYDAATGLLSLTGSTSIANYQDAIRSVSYDNYSDNPNAAPRTISITLNDGNTDSATVNRTIDILPVNDAPVISGIESPAALFTEGTAPVSITDALEVDDVDDSQIQSATVTITSNFAPTEDYLQYTDQNGIIGNFDASTGVLNLTGGATLADYENAVRSITYVNVSADPSPLVRTISIDVTDSGDVSNTLNRDIAVTPVNDPPVLTGVESTPATYTENATPVNITDNIGIADVDDININAATVTISGNFEPAEDQLGFVNQAGITGSYDAVNGTMTLTGAASLGDYQNALRSVSYSNTSDNPSALDRTIDFTVTDNALVSNTLTRTLQITPVNDAPVISGIESQPVAYTEGAAPIAVTATLAVTDLDDTVVKLATLNIVGNFVSGEDLLRFSDQNGITGSYNASNGTLTLSGAASLSAYESAIRSVTYENTSDNPSPLTRTISISVNDNNDISNTLLRDITVNPVNDAPVLDTIEPQPLTYTENGSAVAITGSLTINDLDDTSLESASARITDNFALAEDQLEFTDQSGITGSYDPATGILSLSGSASLTDYTSALRSITYRNISENPTTVDRSIELSVFDGSLNSNTVSRVISVTPVNDAPELTVLDSAPASFTEGFGAVRVTDTISVVDVDDTNIQSAVVTISEDFIASEDKLQFNNQNGIGGSYDPATGTLNLVGDATKEFYEDAIQSVRYSNESDNPSALTKVVSITTYDHTDSSNTVSRDIAITPINDVPVLAAIENYPQEYNENSTPVVISRTLTISDVDDTNIESATVSISSNFVSGEDVLSLSTQSAILGDFDSNNGILHLTGPTTLADYTAALQGITYQNTSDDPFPSPRIITFTVFDGDGTSNQISRVLTVNEINDAPTLSVFSSDADFTAEDTEVEITFNELFAHSSPTDIDGTVTGFAVNSVLSGGLRVGPSPESATPIDSQDFATPSSAIPSSAIIDSTNNAYWTPALNINTDIDGPQAAFTISALDDDNETATQSVAVPVYVSDVNDMPMLTDFSSEFNSAIEDTEVEITLDSLRALGNETDIDGNVELMKVDSVVNGTLRIGPDATDAVRFSDGVIDKITESTNAYWTPDPDINTPTDGEQAAFTVLAGDNDGEFSATPVTLSVYINEVNDEPQGTDNNVTLLEDEDYRLNISDFGFIDPVDNDAFHSIVISQLPDSGVLTLTGDPVEQDAVILAQDIANGLLVFSPTQDNTGNTIKGIGFHVVDDGGNEHGGIATDATANHLLFDISPLNDSPALVTEPLAVDEGALAIIDDTTLKALDVDDAATDLTYTLTEQPANGQLLINNQILTTGARFTQQTISNGELAYQHDGSETSVDSFAVSVADGGEDGATPDNAIVEFIINEVIDPPPQISDSELAIGFAEQTDSNDAAVASLMENLDENFTIEIVSPPTHGTLILEPDGNFSYQHDGSLVLQDNFSYRVINEDGIASLATVNISIEPPISSAFDTPSTSTSENPSKPKPQAKMPDNGDRAEPRERIKPDADSAFTESPTHDRKIDNTTSANTGTIAPVKSISHANQSEYNDKVVLHRDWKLSHRVNDFSITQLEEQSKPELKDLFARSSDELTGRYSKMTEIYDKQRELLDDEQSKEFKLTTSTVTISSGLSIGYIIWLVRGGLLLGSVMSAMPAWRTLDPLPVLGTLHDNEDDTESLESMVEDGGSSEADNKNLLTEPEHPPENPQHRAG